MRPVPECLRRTIDDMNNTQTMKASVIEHLEGFAELYADPECDTISGLKVGQKMASKADELISEGAEGSSEDDGLRAAVNDFRNDLANRSELYDEMTADKAILRLIERLREAH